MSIFHSTQYLNRHATTHITSFGRYKFQFTKEHDLLRVDYPEGKMAANEAINLEWTVTGKLSSPMVYKINCEIRALEGTATSGKPFDIPVQVFTECSYSELCVSMTFNFITSF